MIAALSVLVVIALAISAVHVRRRLRPTGSSDREEAATDFVVSLLTSVYLILVVFIVVVLWQNMDDVNDDVRAEASGLTQLVWVAHRTPAPDHDRIRAAVQSYATAVLDHEWPPRGPAGGAGSAAVLDQAGLDLATPLGLEQQTSFRDQALGILTDLASARQDRLAKSTRGVPGVLISAVAVLSAVVVLTPFLLGPRTDTLTLLGIGVTAALAVAALLLIWDLVDPFSGPLRVDPSPLRTVLATLGSVS